MRSTRIILQLQCELKSHLMLQLNRVSPQHNGFLTAMVPIPFKKKQKTIPRNLKRASFPLCNHCTLLSAKVIFLIHNFNMEMLSRRKHVKRRLE
ncbi:hypothetical protein QL285_021724 [Trifolium repens]|nr:hypothetical protein QL285_021724 [Trifolium repens]